MSVKHSRDVPAKEVKAGELTTIQVLQQGQDFIIRQFTMEPGGGMPNHTNTVEHGQVVLKGQARIGIADDVFDVSAGDVVHIPGGVQHWYSNTGKKNFIFLCIIPNKTDEIKVIDKSC